MAARLALRVSAGVLETNDARSVAHCLSLLEWDATTERYSLHDLVRAFAAAQRLGRRSAEGAALGNLGLAYARLGDARQAISFHEQDLENVHHTTFARQVAARLPSSYTIQA